jgi:hypothetical protein
MKHRLRLRAALVVAVLGLVALPSAATASVTSFTTSGSLSPAPPDATITGVSLSFGFDAGYTGGFSPVPKQTVFHFDNDIAFDPTGLATCSPASIAGMTTAGALAACPGARVGSGTVAYNGGATINGVITAFNGTPSSGHPTVLAHIDINSGAIIVVIPGVIGTSTRGGDFGSQIDFGLWPNTPGVAATHFGITLDNIEPAAGHHYVSARCGDADRTFNFGSDVTFYDLSSRSASATQSCGPTGLRAAALKKCKKKHSKKARKKCRKKAKLLPV